MNADLQSHSAFPGPQRLETLLLLYMFTPLNKDATFEFFR